LALSPFSSKLIQKSIILLGSLNLKPNRRKPELTLIQLKPYPQNLIPHLPEILPLIQDVGKQDPSDFALHLKKESLPVPVSDVATLLDCYQRAEIKFPDIHKPGMLYTKKSIEQSSGQALITYKKLLFSGNRAVDLTGGLGMDTLFLSKKYNEVTYIERDENVLEIARHNHSIQHIQNVTYVCADAESWLESYTGPPFDLIYIDPSRRTDEKRAFLLKDCEPDVRVIYPFLDQFAKELAAKVSPMYDITQLQREIPDIFDIYVISVQSEVKEVLVVSKPGQTPGEYEGLLHVVMLNKKGWLISELASGLEVEDACEVADQPGLFLYEPDPAIIKAGQSKSLARSLGFKMLNYGTDYLTSNDDFPGFSGKKYAISDVLLYKPRQIKIYLQEHQLTNVHIHKRDFPHPVDLLFKKFDLKMGEQAHLFFTKNADGELIVIVGELVDKN